SMIKPHHLKEWTEGSGVSAKITQLNVQSLELDHEIDEILNRNGKSRWKSTDWGTGGWFVSGLDPKTGKEVITGGQFKPDQPVDDRKYLGINDSPAIPLFLNTGDRDYWKNIIDDKSPVIITEGAKKAGALLTIGLPAISLAGVSTGQKLGRLRADLVEFCKVGRRVYLCFDSDIMTKNSVQQALDKLGRLIIEKGAMVSVINLPQSHKGVDDFIVAKGSTVFLSLVDNAQTFEEWRTEINKPQKPDPATHEGQYQDLFLSPKQREMRNLRAIYAQRLRKNLRGNTVELDGEPVNPDYLYLQCLERDGVEVKKDMIIDAFLFFASENEYDPVAKYLNDCYAKYGDTTEHLLSNASDRYMGTTEPIYNTYIRKTMIGAVRRTFDPGCQFETALVLYGKQGSFKSTFWRVLGGDWFDDTVQGFDRDEKQKLHQYWIEEFGEIEKVSNKHDVSQIKAFMSIRNDVFRVPFGRSSKSYSRKFIIVGSTNKPDILQDATGDRRFWIIPLTQPIDIDKVREERDQLWAAAVSLFKKGESAFLPREQDAIREELNKEYRADDPWEEPVTRFVEFFTQCRMFDILKDGLDIPIERHDRRSQDRVATILRSLGWTKIHTRNGKIWQKQESLESHGSNTAQNQVTYINNKESQNNINESQLLVTDVTHDPCDASKLDYLQNQKTEKTKNKSYKVGDRVTLKNGQEGCYITRVKLFNGNTMYHIEWSTGSDHVFGDDILLLESEAIAIGDTVAICKTNRFLDRFKRLKKTPNTLTVTELGGANEAMCKNGNATYQIPVDWIFKISGVTA
ncbi:MAG: VapE domain-containing protein, partial [Pseudanabaena sp.]